MDSLGSEIGQKMRSAVKAKLIELGTGSASGYIDDELPDYVMIMVANKRSRQQMIDDLTLFLGGQTEVFVSWLHQVLQKLEEVTLPATASSIAKDGKPAKDNSNSTVGKRKISEQKDKKDKKRDKKSKRKDKTPEPVETGEVHTPPHPGQLSGVSSIQEVFANQLIQRAKKTLEIEGSVPKKDMREMTPPLRDNSDSQKGNEFDIPTISEIAGQSALQKHQKELSELEEIQQKIKQAKKQLRSMGSDESEDEDFLNIKANDDDLENIEDGGLAAARRREKKRDQSEIDRTKEPEQSIRSNTPPHPAIVPQMQKKKSIMERLGTKPDSKPVIPEAAAEQSTGKSNIISLSAHRREERELYVPVFRRKEMEEQAKAREARSRANRSRSRDRDRRRSPPRPLRRDRSRDRSRGRRDRDRTRSRDRGRDRERERERNRERSIGKVSNGTDIRTRIGSRVIVLPPKADCNEEDNVEVPIPSVVKVQPRPQVPKNKQPSKNLLLKAMAEAQRSTAGNLKKTISNRKESSSKHRRMLIEIPGAKPDETPPIDVRYDYEDDEDEDIVDQVLCGEDDEDDELQQILNSNEEYIPEPVTVSISNRSDTDSDGYVYVPSKKVPEEVPVVEPDNEYDPKDPAENPKFVVTLDGAYKKSSRTSPSHTPPPPSKSKPSIRDRIGIKVGGSENSSTTPPRDYGEDRAHQEALKRRKERFCLKAGSSKENKKESSKSPEKRSKSSKKSPGKKDKRSSSANRKSSPNELNELLLQRTKELDDSVSSSPIYMSKSDYDKIEPHSSSRKRKRVSPIQFALTDDEADDTDGEYNHHRDREHRERKSVERARSIDEASSIGSRKDQRRERESERREKEDDRRKSGSGSAGNATVSGSSSSAGGETKSPTKKIKKLESSRKFDDIPQLLSSVSLPTDSLSKSKGIIKERCKYFPHCRQGDSCEFLHPSTSCKAFPACKFGDKCLYIHPMCKYDKTCHRLDCSFMHTKPMTAHGSVLAAPPLASSVVPVQNYKSISAKPLPAMCKYYPACANGMCPYYHPKMCRFGKHCMNKVECNFYHHELPGNEYHEMPPKDKFKWISPFSA